MPVWFGAPFEVLLKGTKSYYYDIFSVLAILVPVLSFVCYLALMPAFERNLQKLSNYSGSRRKPGLKLSEQISKVICFSREEKIFFRFASNMMRNERDFMESS